MGDALEPVIRLPVAAREHPLAKGQRNKRLPHRLLLDHVQIVQSDRSDLTKGRDFSVYAGRTWPVSDLATKKTLLCAGLGWGYMPEHCVGKDIEEGFLRRLWVEDLRDYNSVPLVVVRRRDRVLGPAARWLLARVLQAAGPQS